MLLSVHAKLVQRLGNGRELPTTPAMIEVAHRIHSFVCTVSLLYSFYSGDALRNCTTLLDLYHLKQQCHAL
jgi:hypothetical protein